jgi:methyltransferase (TIGR00027 family)
MKDEKPSITAILVAYCILILGGDEWGLARIPAGIVAYQAAVLLAAGIPFGKCPYLLCNPFVSRLARFVAAVWYPGFFEGIGFRKLIIDSQVRDFLRLSKAKQPDQQRQVVVVAAGYDTLALRLCKENPEDTFWEVDHPATSRVKSRVWTQDKYSKTILGSQPDNFKHVAADLTVQHLDQALKTQSNYSTSNPTIVIVEGLSMYLTEEQIRNLFTDIEKSVSKGSVVVFDFFGWNERRKQVDVGRIFPLLHHYGITGRAEPWVWGLNPKKAEDFFSDTNWKLLTDVQTCGFENVAALELK